MTNELEKQFFDTFGIEPRKVKVCRNINHCPKKYKLCNNDCKHWQVVRTDYPQITDRHLLELIRILCKRDYDYNLGISDSVEELKNYLLEDCIEYVGDIKHQVRALFGENND